jgi:hypothetical protein
MQVKLRELVVYLIFPKHVLYVCVKGYMIDLFSFKKNATPKK